MRRHLIALAIVCTMISLNGPAGAEAGQQGKSVSVTVAVKQAESSCPSGVEAQRGFVTRKDVNGDGIADTILDYSFLSCGEDPNHWCGTGGCVLQIFASGDGTFKNVFADTVRDYRFRTVGGKAKLLISQNGSACHRAGSLPCERTLTWDGQTFR